MRNLEFEASLTDLSDRLAADVTVILRGPSWLARVAASEMDTGEAGVFERPSSWGVWTFAGTSDMGNLEMEDSSCRDGIVGGGSMMV